MDDENAVHAREVAVTAAVLFYAGRTSTSSSSTVIAFADRLAKFIQTGERSERRD